MVFGGIGGLGRKKAVWLPFWACKIVYKRSVQAKAQQCKLGAGYVACGPDGFFVFGKVYKKTSASVARYMPFYAEYGHGVVLHESVKAG